MKNYAALFEDEDDIFNGTPKSKFWSMINTAHEDISIAILDEIITKYAALEHIVKQNIQEEEINGYLDNYYYEHSEELDALKKSLYMEFVGNLVYKMPQ